MTKNVAFSSLNPFLHVPRDAISYNSSEAKDKVDAILKASIGQLFVREMPS